MKYKMMALILALAVMTWAQTPTQTTPGALQQSTAPEDKEKCPCCDKMSATDAKDAHAGQMHHDMSAKGSKGMASCCASKNAKSSSGGDKDAMSCMKGSKDKTADSCCAGKGDLSCMKMGKDKTASCCGDKCGKDKTAAACCGGDCGKDGEKGCCSKKETTAKNCCQRKLVGENAATAESR